MLFANISESFAFDSAAVFAFALFPVVGSNLIIYATQIKVSEQQGIVSVLLRRSFLFRELRKILRKVNIHAVTLHFTGKAVLFGLHQGALIFKHQAGQIGGQRRCGDQADNCNNNESHGYPVQLVSGVSIP